MVTRYRPSYAAMRNQIVPVMPIDPQGNYVDFVEHQAIVEQLQAINQELLSALEYCSSYLDENKLNSIGAGSKAHMEMQEAITNAKQVMGDKG